MLVLERVAWSIVVIVLYVLLCGVCIGHYRRKKTLHHVVSNDASHHKVNDDSAAFLVAYASQSGTAEQLARRSAQLLTKYHKVQVLALNQVDEKVLSQTRAALFVVSTYGEGEPPDNGAVFAKRFLSDSATLALPHLQFSVMALGDKLYQQFCAFGHQLYQGLCQMGAVPLIQPLEGCANRFLQSAGVYDEMLECWRTSLGLGQSAMPPTETKAPIIASSCEQSHKRGIWSIEQRRHLNPGSPGGAVYQLTLRAQQTPFYEWQAGDLVNIRVEHSQDSRVYRKYSIASVPQNGVIELIVRQHQFTNGQFGIGSGWLTVKAELGARLQLEFVDNPNFHGVSADQAMVLIGSGTGMAGLRAHLTQRSLQGNTLNWLIFGERSRDYDNYFSGEIENWQQQGLLTKVDLTFSRDPLKPQYVQDAMKEKAFELKQWIEQGAAIFVCGSRVGMAQDVDHTLSTILGESLYQQLLIENRYRRDIY